MKQYVLDASFPKEESGIAVFFITLACPWELLREMGNATV
jgi:hypothetical protein